MTDASAREAALTGIGSYRPRRSVTNEELCDLIDSSDEWIRTRSGIVTRGWAADDETLVAMAGTAARGALGAAEIEPAALGMILLATCSDAQPVQPASARLAADLGTEVAAVQINATCAGFCYGLGLARDLVRGGTAEHVLVVGVERLTDIVDKHDRTTAFIFADGAGAVVVSRAEREGVGPVVWGTDGVRGEVLQLTPDYHAFRDDPTGPQPAISMQGRRVFKWAVEEMPKVAEAACKAAGVTLSEIDAFVAHQANQRITDAIVTALELPDSVVVADDIASSGNTSSASIPIALSRMLAEDELHPGDRALIVGFGGGLTYAAQVVTLPGA